MSFYIRKSYKFMSFIYVINYNSMTNFQKCNFCIRIIKKSTIQNIIQIQFMAFYIRKSYKFMSLQNGMNYKL